MNASEHKKDQDQGERVDAPDMPDVPADQAQEAMDSLRAEVERLAAERDDAEGRYRRVLADFANYQKRALANEDEARKLGKSGVLESVITTLDHFEQAMNQDPARVDAGKLAQGLKMIHGELVRAITAHGAGAIEPRPGDEFDPQRHLAVARRAAPGVAPGRIVELFQTGYTLGERVLRPAKVVVAPAQDEG
ncbi:MAG: nucleotide exchange factor GrpE [Phycisphaerales bacterium]|nr:nucleotide exchange factor GrpE [Phycisphaerales bacterium]